MPGSMNDSPWLKVGSQAGTGGGGSREKQRDPSGRHLSRPRLYPEVIGNHGRVEQESSMI